jgi:hypothetical protein
VSWRVAPAIRRLRSQLDDNFPRREKPDGTIGDPAHSARTSDHNPDRDRIVCAVDVKRLSATISNLEIARALVASRDPRIKYVIADGRMWSSYPKGDYPAWAERPYSGVNAHAEHVHLSVTQTGKNSTAAWSAVAALARPTKEDAMTRDQEDKLDRVLALLEAIVRPRRTDKQDHDPQAVDLGDLLTKAERVPGCTCKP